MFVNELLNRMCTFMKIKHITSTAYYRETLGSIEINRKILNEYMRSFTVQYNWDEWIPFKPHHTHPQILLHFNWYTEDYVTELKIKLKHVHNIASKKKQ